MKSITTYKEKDKLLFGGFIDLVYKHKDGYIIIDLNTDRDDGIASVHKRQLAVYKKLFSKLDCMLFLKAGSFKLLQSWRLKQESLLKLNSKNKANELKLSLSFYQSNSESDIINQIHIAQTDFDGLIINPAAFTHTSVAIRDALAIFKKPSIELHISNIYKREEFRHKSLISDVVTGIICGLGANGYILAINAMHELLKNGNR